MLEIHSIHRAVVTVVTLVLATTSMFESGFGERQQAVEQMQQKKRRRKSSSQIVLISDAGGAFHIGRVLGVIADFARRCK